VTPAQKPGGSTTEVVAISKNMKTTRRKPLASRNGQGRAPEGEKKRSVLFTFGLAAAAYEPTGLVLWEGEA